MGRAAGSDAVEDLAKGVIVLRGAGDSRTVLVVGLPRDASGVKVVDHGECAGVGDRAGSGAQVLTRGTDRGIDSRGGPGDQAERDRVAEPITRLSRTGN